MVTDGYAVVGSTKRW